MAIQALKYRNISKKTHTQYFLLFILILILYKPTIDCLNAIKPYITKGAIIGFDELNFKLFPGETIAFKEFFDINKTKIYRSSYEPLISYIIFNE